MTMTALAASRPMSGPRIAPRTAPGWIEEPYTRFGLTPATPTIGAYITDVSLAEPLDDETFAQLHRALLEWKVLFFRGQHLDADQHEAVGRRWGALERHPFATATLPGQRDDRPKVMRFAKDAKAVGQENIWHTDVTWRECPSLGSILRAIEVPAVGGDTLWADMGAAYDLLDAPTRAQIDTLVGLHDYTRVFGRHLPADQQAKLREQHPTAEHPVVRTHPETGRKTLYVNGAFTCGIKGMADADARPLLAKLERTATIPDVQCRFRWSPGSVAFWDNRATQHCVSNDFLPHRRVMERVTVVGDRPF